MGKICDKNALVKEKFTNLSEKLSKFSGNLDDKETEELKKKEQKQFQNFNWDNLENILLKFINFKDLHQWD